MDPARWSPPEEWIRGPGLNSMSSDQTFAVTWDYRCPFARNGHEHLLDGLEAGAPGTSPSFRSSSTRSTCPRVAPRRGRTRPSRPTCLSLAAGVVVRDRFPEQFARVHRSLFAARHDEGGDLRDRSVVREALESAGADADAVLAEVDAGWPAKVVRDEHERMVAEFDVFGVPTFIVGESAVFVRLMTRPEGDGQLARATIDRVLGLIRDHPELNEFKHTRIAR